MIAVLAALLLAAPPDSSLADRNIHQQMLTFELAQEMEAAGTMPAPDDAVDFVAALDRAWNGKVSGQSAAYQRIGTYAAMMAVKHLDPPRPVFCDVWEQVAVPAFVADVRDLAEAPPSLERAPLFFVPNLDWAYGQMLDCELRDDVWDDLAASLRQYEEVADVYLASPLADDDPDSGLNEAYLSSLRSMAGAFVRVADIEQDLRDGALDGAFAEIAAGLGGDRPPYVARDLGRRLALAYAERGDTDRALAVYDLLGRALSDEILPTARLAGWYAEGGAAPDRIDRVRPGTGALLVASDQTADLSGTFDRVGAEGTLDLASAQGEWVLLDFWSIGCGPCIEEIPTLNRLDETYADRLTILSVNNDVHYGTPLDAVRETMDRYGLETTVVSDTPDGELTERFDVVGWPLYLLVDPAGRVMVESREGRRALSLGEVEAYVQALPARP